MNDKRGRANTLGAELLTRAGVKKLVMRDSRTVTPGVLARQLFDDADIGRPKVEALADRLLRIRPDLNVEYHFQNVLLPPVEEQQEIVRRVNTLFALADRIEERVAAAAARAERLTQAVLAKAFRGELVPTEAELARREGRDYETAAALLERVTAERALLPRRHRP